MSPAWTRSLAAIDAETTALEATLARVLAVGARKRSAVVRTALIASLHERLAALWRERERRLTPYDAA